MLEIEGSTLLSLEDDAGDLFLLLEVCDTLFMSLEHGSKEFLLFEDDWLLGTDVNTFASFEDEDRLSLLFEDEGKADGLLPSMRVDGS